MATDEPQHAARKSARTITVIGAGIFGVWQALTLARAGHRVRLVEQSAEPFTASASRLAGVMLSPGCESEAEPRIRTLGWQGLDLWRATYPGLVNSGSLVVAAPRDHAEFARFATATAPSRTLDSKGLGALEPDLSGRFASALYFPDEAHFAPGAALRFLLDAARNAGAIVELGTHWTPSGTDRDDIVVDCRGYAAASALPDLRGVRGERLVIRTDEIRLSRPVRLLHPQHPLYVVPWPDGHFLIGATVIESEDTGPITVRSALALLGAAYTLHPAFGEAAIVETGAGLRPAFPDNMPRAEILDAGRRIVVNGAFRHGFLLAPVLATAVAEYLATEARHELLVGA
ncbi:FAD-dependent oxidoreductase [Hyphomicrobium nitrativorans]|uniref:FAD-dependent oxidoreductase n=1 Tax=Hyphomicrobium nitrativorans TaxID=1427356 RepID=UPI000A69E2E3|nr:FAD-dependent oxidoreductase [Hyphomicrobium nitrativorans]